MVTSNSRPPQGAPPWRTVIATTVRLWMQRHVVPGRGKSASGRHYVRLGVVAAVIVVFAAGAASAALAWTGSGKPPSGAPGRKVSQQATPQLSSAALAAAGTARQQAASWVASQVSHADIVACDPLTCAALQQDGFPASDLEQLGAGSGDPLGSGVVVSTLAVRSQLGSRLAQVYAPAVIASFGSGTSLVQVRVTAVGGAAAYLPAERADLQARITAGRELADNKNLHAPPGAWAELSAGQVDSRLLITLAALARMYPVQISSFGDSGPGGSGPLRLAVVVAPSASYLHQLLSFLQAQRAPLLASLSEHRDGSSTEVQIEFTAPSPLGLFSSGGSP
jgi:hypothetical protein